MPAVKLAQNARSEGGRLVSHILGPMLPRRLALLAASGLLVAALSACSTHVGSSTPNPSADAAAVPRPKRVMVADFAIDPAAVRQDQGIGPRLERSINGGGGLSARIALAHEVQDAISQTAVDALRKAGLPAERAVSGATYRPGDLVVTGRVLRIDEGNRTRRIGIGFGAGKSMVEGTAELSAIVRNGPPVLLQTYDGEADSGRKPGMAVGASSAIAEGSPGIGAISGVANISGEVRRSPVGKEAASFGARLARDVGEYAAQRGWISAEAVPPWTR
jgi:hypothetical protein